MRDTPSKAQKSHLGATLLLSCLAQFMVVLDVSVVNVALPSIKHSLDFTEDGLQWVVNAYAVTFAGFLLLGGRAADLLGRRSTFIFGLILFSLASLAGGLATDRVVLIGARLAQGVGGAVVAPASLSILTSTFTDPKERNRAVGIWGAMGGAGGTAGVLLGGIITDLLSWRWIFFINLPIGFITAFLAQRILVESRNENATRNFDLLGAVTATAGLSVLIFGIVRTNSSGWGDTTTLLSIGIGVGLLAVFILLESKFAKAPLMPLRLFKSRQLSTANVILGILGSSGFAMWFFLSLYLQDALGYSPIRAGLVFLPMTLTLVISSTVASRITTRFGPKRLLIFGMTLLTIGLALLTDIGTRSDYLGELLIPGLVLSFGMPMAFIQSTICATSGVRPQEAGLASAVANTSRLFGGSVGLAILATLAAAHSKSELHRAGESAHAAHQALVSGFQLAFGVSAAFAAIGVIVAIFGMPGTRRARTDSPQTAAIMEL